MKTQDWAGRGLGTPIAPVAMGMGQRCLFRIARLFWLLLFAPGSCGGEAPRRHTLEIALSTSAGALPSQAMIVAFTPDGTSRFVLCGGDRIEDRGLACTATGATLPDWPPGLEVTIKAQGWRFAHARLDPPQAGGSDTLTRTITLQPLPAPVSTEDYATGFTVEGGREEFARLAYASTQELGPVELIKFVIRNLRGEPEVYFQNTRKHPLHSDFVRFVLGVPITPPEFTLRYTQGTDREGMAGTLVRYPTLRTKAGALGPDELVEDLFAVTFFPADDLSAAQAQRAVELIEERMPIAALTGGRRRLAYVPAGATHERSLAAARQLFDATQTLWLLPMEMFAGLRMQILNPGVAFGTLRRMTPEELDRAVLSRSDVVVATRLPNTMPILGGIITEELQTPLSHVNVASRNRGTPNLALLDAGTDPRVAPLLGQLVRFEVQGGDFSLRPASLDEATAFWAGQGRTPKTLVADVESGGLPALAELGFADVTRVGAKAANLAELRKVLGDTVPDGFAVPFHHYDTFLRETSVTAELCDGARADCVAEKRSPALCDRARLLCKPPGTEDETFAALIERLLGDGGFATDTALREAALDSLRHSMRHAPVSALFAAQLDARVAELFGLQKVRLRSSTNSEDGDEFSGAGLYDSVSARGGGDDAPSREIRKVWSSVWTFRAFEERTFWALEHRSVRMAVAVHRAFPAEGANGVILTQNISDPTVAGMYVNVQLGEALVTNPQGGTIPEILVLLPGPIGVEIARQRFSSLSPGQPILSADEAQRLYLAAQKVQNHFARLYHQSPNALTLDLEFKLDGPERALVVKQVRPYLQAQASLP